jgi:hypothetical protein
LGSAALEVDCDGEEKRAADSIEANGKWLLPRVVAQGKRPQYVVFCHELVNNQVNYFRP